MATATKGTAAVEWSRPSTTNTIGVISVTWTSTTTGNVIKILGDDLSSWDMGGTITKVVTNPSATAPTSGHLITLTDEDSVDVLNTLGGLSAAVTTSHYIQNTGAVTGTVQQSFRGLMTFNVSGAGSSKKGTTRIYYR